jgi:hypothetical protein
VGSLTHVVLSTGLGVGDSRVPPVAHMLHLHASEVVAGARRLLAVSHVILAANGNEGILPLVVLLLLVVVLLLRLAGGGARSAALGPGSYEGSPIGLQFPCGEKSCAVTPVVRILAYYEIYKLT